LTPKLTSTASRKWKLIQDAATCTAVTQDVSEHNSSTEKQNHITNQLKHNGSNELMNSTNLFVLASTQNADNFAEITNIGRLQRFRARQEREQMIKQLAIVRILEEHVKQ
jgi:hypothetical protein